MLDKFTDCMERVLGPVADFMSSNKYICAITNAFTMLVPMVIAGSFAFMLQLFLCSEKSGLAGLAGFEWLAGFSNVFSVVNFACISCMALWVCGLIAYSLGSSNGDCDDLLHRAP